MASTSMYDVIQRNKRNSVLLIILMCLFVATVAAVFGAYMGGTENALAMGIIWAVGGITFAGLGALTSFFTGTQIIMTVSGAQKANREKEPQLYNIVEEMCIASGLPMPDVYIIEDGAPNAFATGRSPRHSAIAVTRGLMRKLNREELQGVVAHEMSHIENFDVLYATLMCVLVGTIVLMCDMLWRISLFGGPRSRRSRNNSGGGKGHAIIAIIAILLMIIAPVLAYIIQMATSREREYLADASAAKMTRNPLALARALEKIAQDPAPLESANRGTQQLYIVNPLKGKAWANTQTLFSTHPPICSRVARLKEIT